MTDTLSRAALAARIEHTFLKAEGGPQDLERLCQEAREHGFKVAMVNPAELERARELLAGSGVRLGTVVGFPLGQNASVVKAFETEDALTRGAVEVDLVLNVRALIGGSLNVVRRELAQLSESCRAAGAVSKAILETCYLAGEQKRLACRLALDCGVDYVKTSTGFGAGGATVADVQLMREAVGRAMKIKASGGIRDLATARAMLDAGADRLGTSNSVAIVTALPG